jgi:hypothetical protein
MLGLSDSEPSPDSSPTLKSKAADKSLYAPSKPAFGKSPCCRASADTVCGPISGKTRKPEKFQKTEKNFEGEIGEYLGEDFFLLC